MLLSFELTHEPPTYNAEQRAGKGSNQIFKRDFQITQPKVDVQHVKNYVADYRTNHPDCQIDPSAKTFLGQRRNTTSH